jgi:sialidase-1
MRPNIRASGSLVLVWLATALAQTAWVPTARAAPAQLRKLEDLAIYKDDQFYSSFPSIVRRPDGELLVAFRRAPERRRLGEKGYSHTDPNSYLMLVRSHDQGKTWSAKPELLFAHPFGGSQDPCMVQLRDGTIVCTSYGWAWLNEDYLARLTNSAHVGRYGFLGGFLLRSSDGGHSWDGPLTPCHVPTDPALDIFGKPVPAYNRGALCEGKDGRLYWVVAASTSAKPPHKSETHLLISSDQGVNWRYACPVATDTKVQFNESSLYETPKGDLVAFMRTEGFNDHTAVARSTNQGKSFGPWEDAGFMGHPHYALRLPDQRVLLVYGYRHAPFGVRARVLDPECDNLASAQELVLREDGGSGDLGYPWATMVSPDRALVVYYFNQADGTRFIAGTMLELGPEAPNSKHQAPEKLQAPNPNLQSPGAQL